MEALHEQIADLSNLVAELNNESLERRSSLIEKEFEGGSGPGLGFDSLPLPSQEMKRGGVVEESGATAPLYPDSPASSRKSVSVRTNSAASARNSFAKVGA